MNKFVAFLALVAAASSNKVSSFSYDVSDPSTGDVKSQVENREDNNVVGQYSLLESDGTRRIVDYTAGAEGFNAIVRKDPAVIAAQATYAAPVAYSAAAPVAYSAAAPVAYSAATPVAYTAAAPLPYSAATPFAYSAPFGYNYARFGVSPYTYARYF